MGTESSRSAPDLLLETVSIESAPAELAVGHSTLCEGETVAGRYRIEALLGRGGFGAVYRVRDLLREEVVALKVIRGGSPDRHQRETAALRLLQIPGVVKLRDEFEAEGAVCIVMDYVEGRPFPGVRSNDWSVIEPVARALLETLGRVHSFGVVHRDLKPANVLVTDRGQPHILDFGLSGGRALGATVTQAGQILGTPAYLAPEQLFGSRTDARTDLFCVGAMFYEALCGSLPHAEGGPSALLNRGTRPAAPVRTLAPGVPEVVAATIDAMLAVGPDDRPGSAAEVLARLGGGASAVGVSVTELPWLGSRELCDAIYRRAREGRSSTIGGPAGAGRTRTAREAARRLEAEGRVVVVVGSAARPLASLNSIVSPMGDDSDWATVRDAAAAQLSAWLEGGGILVVEHRRPPDRWSADLIASCRERGAVIESRDGPEELEPEPLRSESLASLFVGHEALFHVPSDAARILHARTGGNPGRVVEELRSWTTARLVRRVEGGFELGRAEIVRLSAGLASAFFASFVPPEQKLAGTTADLVGWLELAWPFGTEGILARASGLPRWEVEATVGWLVRAGFLARRPDGVLEPRGVHIVSTWPSDQIREAHRTLAALLPRNSPSRLFHLAASGDDAELVQSAADIGRDLAARGKLAEAEVVVSDAVQGLRSGEMTEAARRLLSVRTLIALEARSAPAYRRARIDLGRTGLPSGSLLIGLRQLLEAAELAVRDETDRALAVLDALEAFDDQRLERHRRALRALATSRDQQRRERELVALEEWALAVEDRETMASVASWRAMGHYRSGALSAAAELHQEAARMSERPIFRLGAELNAAAALLELGRYEAAALLAHRGVETARALRHVLMEARGLWLVRSTALRSGDPLPEDPDLLAACSALGNPSLFGQFLLVEAAAAWVRDDLHSMRTHAEGASAAWRECGLEEPRLWSLAMAWLAGADATPPDLSAAVAVARTTRQRNLAAQMTAALLSVGTELPPGLLPRARGIVREIPTSQLEHHQGLWTWKEMGVLLGA